MALLQPETMTLGDTTFTVGCQPATVGWDLSAEVANLLGTVEVPGTVVTGDAQGVLAAARALMAIPAPQLKRVRTSLFEYVEFTELACRHTAETGRRGGDGVQRAGLSSVDIWKVFAAAFRVNFRNTGRC